MIQAIGQFDSADSVRLHYSAANFKAGLAGSDTGQDQSDLQPFTGWCH